MTHAQSTPDSPPPPDLTTQVSDELWAHVATARYCVEINPSPEAMAVLRAHLEAFEVHFLGQKVIH